MGLSAKSLYAEFPARYLGKVACDTLSPTTASYHVEFTEDFAETLCRHIASQGLDSMFYHFKGYSKEEVIFTFHDTFQGTLEVSGRLREDNVREFAGKLGLIAQADRLQIDLHKQLLAWDRLLNPPWWRRILNKCKTQPEL